MFAVYQSGRSRQTWSKKTIAISVAAHVAVLGAIGAGAGYAAAQPRKEAVIADWKLEEKPVPKPPTPPPPPPPPEPLPPEPRVPPKVELAREPEMPRMRRQPPAPVKGDFVALRPPEHAPLGIPAVDPNAKPVTVAEVSGQGKEGDVVGPVDSTDHRAPTGHTEPAPPTPEPAKVEASPPSDGPMEESEVDVRPSLRNGDEVQRALQRLYPTALREAGVTGQTVLQFVIGENGRVEPGSVEVVSSANDEFAAAARRIVGTLRFSPARSRGHNVRVTTTLPVTWTISP